MMTPILRELRDRLENTEAGSLSGFGCPSTEALRRRTDERTQQDHRLAFSLDSDRILHSLAYTRYIDKTQVFYLIDNDHLTHRVLHVQLLSKIGRTIGRFLGLNEDLIEAISLGHDIGHPPFGHDGERALAEICREQGIGTFLHNAQSVRFLDLIERDGRGWNLSLQVLDGILCHNGETHDRFLGPLKQKDFALHDREVERAFREGFKDFVPMTLEGCVVRIADTISYIGRDIEDAIRINLIEREEIPARCAKVLGTTNGAIVYNLVKDVILNSRGKGEVGYSGEVSDALKELKSFNYERIYNDLRVKKETPKIEFLYQKLFETYLGDLEEGREDSPVIRFIRDKKPEYLERANDPERVRDFIAGMTDAYFMKRAEDVVMPKKLPGRFG
jgi:dGTPase